MFSLYWKFCEKNSAHKQLFFSLQLITVGTAIEYIENFLLDFYFSILYEQMCG